MTGYVGAPNSLARLAQKLEDHCLRVQFLENMYHHVGSDLRWDRAVSSAAMNSILSAYAEMVDGGAL